MIPARLHTGRDAGRSTIADLDHLGEVGPVADRVAATWRRVLPGASRRHSALGLALRAHEVELARLFAKGVRLTHLARALEMRGVMLGDKPVTRHAVSMSWLRVERARAERRGDIAA